MKISRRGALTEWLSTILDMQSYPTQLHILIRSAEDSCLSIAIAMAVHGMDMAKPG